METTAQRMARMRARRKSTRERLDAQAAAYGYERVPDALVYVSAEGKLMAFREDGTRI